MAMPSSTAEKVQELTKIGNEHLLHHRYQEALKEFQAALSLTESIEQPKLKISCILNAGACLITIGEMQRGINLLQSALSLLDSFPSGENESEHLTTRADIYYNIGVGNHRLSDHTQAAVQLKQSIDLYMKNGQQSTAGDAFCALALCYKDSGNVNQQEMSLLSAMELYQQVGDVGNEAMTCIELAIAYQCSKNQEKCLQMLTTARILAARLEDQILHGYTFIILIVYSIDIYLYREDT
jgi:tetratricopeptide (TPR) repeat protein